MSRVLGRFMMALMAALLAAGWAQAHKPSDSYLTLRATTSSPEIAVRWDIALRDLDYVLQLDRNADGALTWGEVRLQNDNIMRYATTHLQLSSQGKVCPWRSSAPMMLDHHSDGTYAVLSLTAACSELVRSVQVNYALLLDVDPSHRGLLQWIAPGGEAAQALVLGSESALQSLPLAAPSELETLRQYVVDGVWHIWVGYDHILFLLALLLPAVLVRRQDQSVAVATLGGSVKDVLKVVTAFTLAHSITLSLAALQIISLPSRLVESAIAASVIVAALNNLRGAIDSRRWVMAFAFGLIHGFGFATVLADLGLPQDALVLALVGFNVGVELGQLAIVGVFLPLAFQMRSTWFYRQGVLKGGSVLVALLAAWWLAQRLFDL